MSSAIVRALASFPIVGYHFAMQPRAPLRVARRRVRRRDSWQSYLSGVAASAAMIALAYAFLRHIELADAIMLYLLGVVAIATRLGIGPSILSAVVGALAFDYFVIPPLFHFTIADFRHVVTLGGMVAVALIVSALTERLRQERERALRSEQRTSALYALERDLAQARSLEQLAAVATMHFAEIVDAKITFFAAENGREPKAIGVDTSRAALSTELELVNRVLSTGDSIWPAPLGQGFACEPLRVGHHIAGAVVMEAARPGSFGRAEQELVEAGALQVAGALDRLALAHETEMSRVEVEKERVRNAVLSSISHDLRTPLATISASAQMLLRNHAQMDPALRAELLSGVAEQVDRLDDLLRNLMAMTRVEAGELGLRCVPGAVQEVAATAVRRCARSLAGRTADLRADRGVPLVAMDASLMEQVFVNLLENAARYSPAGTPIAISVVEDTGNVAVEVIDDGPGVPAEELEKIFDKFYRGRNAPRSDGNLGLGLAICRAIVGAHGGTISLRNGLERGAIVRIVLPAAAVSLSEAALRLPELT
jgi:two-component system sensor histidine kinase KdpD